MEQQTNAAKLRMGAASSRHYMQTCFWRVERMPLHQDFYQNDKTHAAREVLMMAANTQTRASLKTNKWRFGDSWGYGSFSWTVISRI
jgi:hypothetical protein